MLGPPPAASARPRFVEPFLVSDDVHLVRALAGAGHAIAYRLALPSLAPGEPPVERVLPDLVGAARDVILLVPDSVAETPRMRTFIDLHVKLAEQMAPMMAWKDSSAG